MTRQQNDENERDIPNPIKREVRQRCGFGCVFCGLPIYDYHHIDDWADVKKHEPTRITLLCDHHHRRATSGLLSREQVEEANANPINVRRGVTSPETLAFEGDTCDIAVGGGLFFGTSGGNFVCAPLVVQGIPLIGVSVADGHFLLDVLLLEDDQTPLLKIVKNELVITTGQWDVEFIGRTLSLRNAPRQITLEIELTPPSRLAIKRGFFYARGSAIRVDPSSITLINSANDVSNMHWDL
jgi:hypothetical protein